ncbi:MAG: OmpA family protein [Betaproteobacteria bacterium]
MAERARQAEIEAAARARQAELEAAERERRGRVETAANQVLIGENEKLQTLDGMLPAVLNMDDKGQFDFDSYALSDAVKAQLDEIAARLAVAPYDRLHVVGFTDRIGPEDYNRKLSEKRAWSVAGYLMDKGVPPYKLKVEGKGETGSLVAEEECKGLKRDALIECLQRDRRVELVATVKEYNLKVQ